MIREMEYIYAIYREKSFSQAAKKLHVSQPALSGMVRKVENRLNATLFDRSATPVALTSDGEFYIRCAEKILQVKYEMDGYFQNKRQPSLTVINVGAAAFYCMYALTDIARDFTRKHPSCRINLSEINASDDSSELLKSTLDFIVDVRADLSDDIAKIILYREAMLLAVPLQLPVNHGLERYRLTFADINNNVHLSDDFPAVDMRRFKDERFFMLRNGYDTMKRALAVCSDAGFSPNIAGEFDQMLSSYRMVMKGDGVAFVRDGVPKHMAASENIVFYKINKKFFYRDIMLNYYKGKELSSIMLQFINFVTNTKQYW